MENNDNHNDENDNESGDGPKWADVLKKLSVLVLALLYDWARRSCGDFKVPKDVVNLVLQGASKSKEELMNRESGMKLLKSFLKSISLKKLHALSEEHKFRVSVWDWRD